jgi:positive phototaxis protein PixI
MAFNDAASSDPAIDSTPLPTRANPANAVNQTHQATHQETSGESFLRFYLLSNLPVLLSVHQLAEILTLSLGQIVPMFEMPAWVMGVYNWRGEVLWMIDLNHFLGLTPWYQQSDYSSKHTVVVLKSQSQGGDAQKEAVLGLVVNRVEDMVFCPPESIQPLSEPLLSEFLSTRIATVSEIQPFLRGYWHNSVGKSAEESIGDLNLVLEGAAIMSAMPTSDHQAIF